MTRIVNYALSTVAQQYREFGRAESKILLRRYQSIIDSDTETSTIVCDISQEIVTFQQRRLELGISHEQRVTEQAASVVQSRRFLVLSASTMESVSPVEQVIISRPVRDVNLMMPGCGDADHLTALPSNELLSGLKRPITKIIANLLLFISRAQSLHSTASSPRQLMHE